MGDFHVRYGLCDNNHKRVERQAHGPGADLVSVHKIRDRPVVHNLVEGSACDNSIVLSSNLTSFRHNLTVSSVAVVLDSRIGAKQKRFHETPGYYAMIAISYTLERIRWILARFPHTARVECRNRRVAPLADHKSG